MKFFVLLLLVGVNLRAQGGSAVISLVMPPPGAEGFQSLQFGGAFPEGAASLYYNPALLSNLARSTGSQFQFNQSSQDLIPCCGGPDLNQQFWSAYAVAPDPKQGFDLGIGFFRNRVNLGRNWSGDNFLSNETVYAMGVGIRLGVPISLGGSVKFYDSRLSRQFRAYGWAFDFGATFQPRILPLAPLGIRSFSFLPSVGFSWQNMGPDAFYFEATDTDPIPTTLRQALGLKLKFSDAIELSVGKDFEQEIHRRVAPGISPVIQTGYSIFFLGYRFSQGWLDDKDGERNEMHFSSAFELNLLHMMRFIKRVETGDFHSASESISTYFPFHTTRIFGIPFRANPRMVVGTREIRSRDNGIRDGQDAFYWSLSL